ncbi:MAG: pyridoxal-phosphate dependent enzyme [Myxococcota bacterium]
MRAAARVIPPTAPARREASLRVCGGCGAVVESAGFVPRCPNAGDGGDHVLMRELDESWLPLGLGGDLRYAERPFLRWRHRLHAWHQAMQAGWSDEAFIALVERLDHAVAEVDGRGFRVTPLRPARALAHALRVRGPLWVKDETHAVGGSHKARHLFGILLGLEVAGQALADRPLAIASCGNAALAAAVLARAAKRRLQVFIPPDAEAAVVKRLDELGADIVVCRRVDTTPGDPCVTAFRAAVQEGALPFACQGPENGMAIEGGETLGWELVTQLAALEPMPAGGDVADPPRLDRVFVQVGGGALGAAVGRALQQATASHALGRMPRIHAVQTAGAWPLARAYERLARRLDAALGHGREGQAPGELELGEAAFAFRNERAGRLALAFGGETVQAELRRAAQRRSEFMWPWEQAPNSVAHGILDDETYDWLALTRAMLQGGGYPIVVDEPTLIHANALGVGGTSIAADETGTAGLAGLYALRDAHGLDPTEVMALLFSGVRRRVAR